jgi:hypothetical protein
MEHLVRSIHTAPELADYTDDGFEDGAENSDERRSNLGSERSQARDRLSSGRSVASLRRLSRRSWRSASPAESVDGEKVTPEMERQFFGSPSAEKSKRFSEMSMIDVADRHLRDKTDAIAHIIRSINDQCAAAVEGLQLAHNAESEPIFDDSTSQNGDAGAAIAEEDAAPPGHVEGSEAASEAGFDDASSHLTPNYKHTSLSSTIPPTPDLVHNRSSTAMSVNSVSTANDSQTQQDNVPQEAAAATKIVGADDEPEARSEAGQGPEAVEAKTPAAVEGTVGPVTQTLVQ